MGPLLLSLAFGGPILFWLIIRLRYIGRRLAGYPPGPPTLPVLGNLHQMPARDAHLQFQKWAQEYGPIYSLILGTQTMIVLSSDQAVKDLLDKRSCIYSSRPDMYIGSELVSGGLRVVLMKYGPPWRMIHKMVHVFLNINAARSYVPYQELENKQMLAGLLDTPNKFVDHIRRYTNSLTTQIIYGFRVVDNADPKLKQLFDGFEKFSEVANQGSAALLDLYPILRHLPDFCLPLRRYARELHRKELGLYKGHWMEAKAAVKAGTAKPSFSVNLFKAQELEGFSDDLGGYISGALLEAGSDTTAAILVGFVQAMVVFPEVQKKAHEEIDRVVRPDRLPTMEDERNMQYIRGCVKESLRWMPPVPLGVPHALIKDDSYLGYKLPNGATVINNVWAIHMDPNRHPSPRTFDPSRYASDNQTASEAALNPDASQRDQFVFGAGRRLCQGMHIAERSLFLGISRLLWAFQFDHARDASGNEVPVDIKKLTQGLVVLPEPFEAHIYPRSEERAELVRKEWRDCASLLDEKRQWREVPKGMVFSTYKESELKSELKS